MYIHTYLLLGRPLMICVFMTVIHGSFQTSVAEVPPSRRLARAALKERCDEVEGDCGWWLKALAMGIQSNNSDIIYRYIYIYTLYIYILYIYVQSTQ